MKKIMMQIMPGLQQDSMKQKPYFNGREIDDNGNILRRFKVDSETMKEIVSESDSDSDSDSDSSEAMKVKVRVRVRVDYSKVGGHKWTFSGNDVYVENCGRPKCTICTSGKFHSL